MIGRRLVLSAVGASVMLGFGPPAFAQISRPTISEKATLVRSFFAALNRKDYQALLTMFSERHVGGKSPFDVHFMNRFGAVSYLQNLTETGDLFEVIDESRSEFSYYYIVACKQIQRPLAEDDALRSVDSRDSYFEVRPWLFVFEIEKDEDKLIIGGLNIVERI